MALCEGAGSARYRLGWCSPGDGCIRAREPIPFWLRIERIDCVFVKDDVNMEPVHRCLSSSFFDC